MPTWKLLDDTVKKPFENPSIGLILCKSADKTFVEYLIQDYDRPMGVATYKSKEDILKVLPPAEELEKLLDGEDKKEEWNVFPKRKSAAQRCL